MNLALEPLARFAASHRDPRNIATHTVGVPLVVFALALLLAWPPLRWQGVDLTPAWALLALVVPWYLLRGLVLGGAVCAGLAALTLLAHQAAAELSHRLVLGAGLLAVGWGVQRIGHWYEGRDPGRPDDLRDLLGAPLFVTADLLFSLGWNRPLAAALTAEVGPTRLNDLAHPVAAGGARSPR